jgi:cell division protease FtsH
VMDRDEKRLTAFHEAGHAVVMARVTGGEPLHKVTIIPRGMALGATLFLPKKDRLHFTRTQMMAQLATSMGGRVAEELFLDDISSGASHDLHQATELARHMVCDWGMSAKLGPRTFGSREEMMFLGREVGRTQDFSETTAQAIDAEVDALVRTAYQQARDILTANSDRVQALVALLMEQETVDGAVAEDLIRLGRIRSPEERDAAQMPAPAADPQSPVEAAPETAPTDAEATAAAEQEPAAAADAPADGPPPVPDA